MLLEPRISHRWKNHKIYEEVLTLDAKFIVTKRGTGNNCRFDAQQLPVNRLVIAW